MPLQALQDAPRLGRWEGLIERCRAVGVEVVRHQHDARGGGKGLVDQLAHGIGEVDGGAVRGDADLAPAQMGGTGQKQVAAAGAGVVAVLPGVSSRRGRLGRAGVGLEVLARFIETDQRPARIDRTGRDGQHVLHGRHKGRVGVGGGSATV